VDFIGLWTSIHIGIQISPLPGGPGGVPLRFQKLL
jgi:hypothetical protein